MAKSDLIPLVDRSASFTDEWLERGARYRARATISVCLERLTPFPRFMTFSRRRLFEHTLFWAAVLVFYTLYFGSRQDEYGQSLFFVVLLLDRKSVV